jgi:hypothetical protein
MQIVARHVAASLAAVGFGTTIAADASNVSIPPLQTAVPAAQPSATIRRRQRVHRRCVSDEGGAGRIFYRLLQMYVQQRRRTFTNKEIRLDPALKLPDFRRIWKRG